MILSFNKIKKIFINLNYNNEGKRIYDEIIEKYFNH